MVSSCRINDQGTQAFISLPTYVPNQGSLDIYTPLFPLSRRRGAPFSSQHQLPVPFSHTDRLVYLESLISPIRQVYCVVRGPLLGVVHECLYLLVRPT